MQKTPQRFSKISQVLGAFRLLRIVLVEIWIRIVSSSEGSQVQDGRMNLSYGRVGFLPKNERFLAVQAAHSAALEILGLLDPDSEAALPVEDGSPCFPNREEFNQESAEMTRLQVLQSAGISELGHTHTINQSIFALFQ